MFRTDEADGTTHTWQKTVMLCPCNVPCNVKLTNKDISDLSLLYSGNVKELIDFGHSSILFFFQWMIWVVCSGYTFGIDNGIGPCITQRQSTVFHNISRLTLSGNRIPCSVKANSSHVCAESWYPVESINVEISLEERKPVPTWWQPWTSIKASIWIMLVFDTAKKKTPRT